MYNTVVPLRNSTHCVETRTE
jgi:hypothetical protein